MPTRWMDKQFERELIKREIIPRLYKACLLILAEAKRLMAGTGPLHAVDTGTLMNNLIHEVLEADLLGRVGPNKESAAHEYAAFVFLGTYKMAPRPILRTALANMRSQIQEIFA